MNDKVTQQETRNKRAVEIGRHIQSQREAKGWSQKSLAKKVGIQQSQLSDYEKGKVRASQPNLEKLAVTLGVPIQMLTTGSSGEVWQFGEIFETRREFWNANIRKIILESDRFILFDSFVTPEHDFREALRQRLLAAEPFELVFLILKEDDPFLQQCLSTMEIAPPNPTEIDIRLFQQLATFARAHDMKGKTVEAYYWKGVSPGPLISWTKAGSETICLGFWLNNPDATDGVHTCV